MQMKIKYIHASAHPSLTQNEVYLVLNYTVSGVVLWNHSDNSIYQAVHTLADTSVFELVSLSISSEQVLFP